MEKLQTILLILFGLGVFIWRMVRKAIETTARESRERPRPKVPSLPDTSFKELLKQMQAQNQPDATPRQPVGPAPTTPADRPLPRETTPPPHSLERTEVRPISLEEKATNRANQETVPRARRAATLPRATSPLPKAYNRPSGTTNPTRRTVRDSLRNATDVRAAFVLSEVLRRKF
ncbi:hypothetical protein MUN82_06135 [Hymenobacter aerilatus]|uniref:Uncharacterized protein n=1 Tax=Hymenobacter aerilatus TaxID=2932251 RepID=A0A8T9T120_9BACT|nr:hypothetical protein [Hymenobacter aerilatus]UOR06673.1 hypothetical protein MUN82_06135 [Hymenobacter aerilatus]